MNENGLQMKGRSEWQASYCAMAGIVVGIMITDLEKCEGGT